MTKRYSPIAATVRQSLCHANGRSSRELFICGTTSQSSRKFVKEADKRGTPVFSLPLELAWNPDFTPGAAEAISQRVVAAYAAAPRVILNVGLPPVRAAAVARRLSDHLVEIAGLVLRRVEVGHVYAEGGATAAELVRRMGWSRLNTLAEPAPGVALLAIEGNPAQLLAVKPGTYAWPEEWTGARIM